METYLDIVYSVALGTLTLDNARAVIAGLGAIEETELQQVTFMFGRVQSALSQIYRIATEEAGRTREQNVVPSSPAA
jgi:hypothetical protein